MKEHPYSEAQLADQRRFYAEMAEEEALGPPAGFNQPVLDADDEKAMTVPDPDSDEDSLFGERSRPFRVAAPKPGELAEEHLERHGGLDKHGWPTGGWEDYEDPHRFDSESDVDSEEEAIPIGVPVDDEPETEAEMPDMDLGQEDPNMPPLEDPELIYTWDPIENQPPGDPPPPGGDYPPPQMPGDPAPIRAPPLGGGSFVVPVTVGIVFFVIATALKMVAALNFFNLATI